MERVSMYTGIKTASVHIIFRLRNDLYCVERGVKLYSLTCTSLPHVRITQYEALPSAAMHLLHTTRIETTNTRTYNVTNVMSYYHSYAYH